jgi:SAM-dependent methyltransferase
MHQIISCPACDSHLVGVVDAWPMGAKRQALACQDCGLLFVHPQPGTEALTAQYAREGSYREKRAGRVSNAQTKTKGGAPIMLAALDRHFAASRPSAGARVLDFGCGTGTWLNTFQDHGWETFGIDPSTDAAFVRHQRLAAVPSEPQFDFVIVYQVLEHLGRPLDILRDLARSLRPGGHCLVSVPRVDTIDIHRDVKYCLQPRTHIVAFTEACLSGLLARAGLGVVEALHSLTTTLDKGRPTKLRLLARKGQAPLATELPADAIRRVLDVLPAVLGDE